MRNITQITTHETDGNNRQLSQDYETQFASFAGAFFSRIQGLENVAFPLISERYLSNATGATLENIGTLVGMPRPTSGVAATDDDSYRVLVYGKIAANVSYGTKTDVYNIMGALGSTQINVFNVYPAALTVNYIGNAVISDCACIRAILENATSPIELDIVRITETPFGFEGDSTASGFGAGQIGGSA